MGIMVSQLPFSSLLGIPAVTNAVASAARAPVADAELAAAACDILACQLAAEPCGAGLYALAYAALPQGAARFASSAPRLLASGAGEGSAPVPELPIPLTLPLPNRAVDEFRKDLERLGTDVHTAVERLREAAERASGSEEAQLAYLRALVLGHARARDAMALWRPTADKFSNTLHEGFADALLSFSILLEAREVLERIPPDELRTRPNAKALWNQLLHFEDVDELGGSVFPLFVDFETRWEGPRLTHPGDVSPLPAWYPAKIEEIRGDDVTLLLGQRLPDGETELFRATLARSYFPEGIEAGDFLEVHVLEEGEDGETVVCMHQKPSASS